MLPSLIERWASLTMDQGLQQGSLSERQSAASPQQHARATIHVLVTNFLCCIVMLTYFITFR